MARKYGRKKGRLYAEVMNQIKDVVRKYPGASTQEVASRGRIGWGTANKYLKVLEKEKKVKSRRRGSRKIWY